jgi:pyruvate, water dikinase
VDRSGHLPLHIFATRSGIARRDDWSDAPSRPHPVLDFEELLSRTPFVAAMREILQVLQQAYDYPVDLEFTANFFADDVEKYKLNLVQCRPLQVASDSTAVALPKIIDPADCVLEARGAVIGRSRANRIDRVVYVVPTLYGQLPLRDCYAIARLIGRLLHLDPPEKMGTGSKSTGEDRRRSPSGQVPVPIFSQPQRVMLVGPGRWGTTTPSLGVPVCFAEIASVSVLCEIVAMRDDLVPDVSLGTHFFNDLVEMDMLYLALFPRRDGNSWNRAFFEQSPNRLAELLPDEARWADVVRVIDLPLVSQGGARLKLSANSVTQQVMCYLERT